MWRLEEEEEEKLHENTRVSSWEGQGGGGNERAMGREICSKYITCMHENAIMKYYE